MYKSLRKSLNYIPFFVLIQWATFSQNKTISQKYNSDFGIFEMYNMRDFEIELDTFLFKELNIKSVSDTVPSLIALIKKHIKIGSYGELQISVKDTLRFNLAFEMAKGKDYFPDDLLWFHSTKIDEGGFVMYYPISSLSPNNITKELVKKVEISDSEHGNNDIKITLNDEGKERMKNLTEQNLYKYAPVIFQNKIIFCPFIRDPILSGRITINGKFDEQTLDLFRSLFN